MTMPALSEEQAPAADPDQATLTGAPESRLTMAPARRRRDPLPPKAVSLPSWCCRGLPPSRSHHAWL